MSATITKQTISEELTERVLATVRAKAIECGAQVTIAIVDESCVLKAFLRMDGAKIASIQAAQDKAHTAGMFQWDTARWDDYLAASTTTRVAAANAPGLNVYGGGCAIRVGDEVVGAVGVSGGSVDQDTEIAQAWHRALTPSDNTAVIVR